ncbi:MAG: TetR/AcrR family transcriptional regulator [Gemmatimonadota bacterium]
MTRNSPSSPERLLEAASAEFSRAGRAGARTDRIARQAGVNKQLIHYYFRTKDGLYEAVLARAIQEVAEALSHLPLVGLTAVERLRRLVRGQFDFLATHGDLTRLLARADTPATWLEMALAPMVALLTEGQATGFFRDDIDPLQHARQALLLNLGYFSLESITSSWGERSIWRDRTADLIVRGCTW